MNLDISKHVLITLIFIATITETLAEFPHVITFKSPNIYPEGVVYDPLQQHFLVGSLHDRTIFAVSDAGVVETIISDLTLPVNSSFLGLTVDRIRNRLLVAVHSIDPLPPFNALASYDLKSRQRLFLSILDGEIDGSRQTANDVTVDYKGNAYVTNSVGNFIWKVDINGEPSIFSNSSVFTSHPVDREAWYSSCGLNGIVYVSKGYLLVVQSNTGKMYKVDIDDGTARTVILTEDLMMADGMTLRSDGAVIVVSSKKAWFVTSKEGWSEGVVYDQTTLNEEGFPTAICAGREDRIYVLYGHLMEGMKGDIDRDMFAIEEIRSEKESEEEHVWIYVLIGLGFVYFLVWRFQLKHIVESINKKTS